MGFGFGFGWSGTVGGDGGAAQPRTLIQRFDAPPSAPRATLINDTLAALQTAGLLAKLDCLYLAGADEQGSRLNWVQDRYNLVVGGAPVFTADRGFQGDGNGSGVGTAQLNSMFNPLTVGGKFQQDSAFVYEYTNNAPSPTSGNTFAYSVGSGTTAAGVSWIRSLTNATSMLARLNSGATPSAIALDVDKRTRLGSRCVSRLSSTEFSAYANGVKQGATIANASAAPSNETLRILRSGNSAAYGQDRVPAAAWGSGLSDVEQADLDTIIVAYLTAIGAN